MSNVPNLDAMEIEELMKFWNRHKGGAGYKELFPHGGQGKKRMTSNLANYASNLATAKVCRLDGRIETALIYERICDTIYEGLPSWALWSNT